MSGKPNSLDLKEFLNKDILVKFVGGRVISGNLKGYDEFLNLVIDECYEYIRDENDVATSEKRFHGMLIARGSQIVEVNPCEGSKKLESNPFE